MRASWPSKYFVDQTTWRCGYSRPEQSGGKAACATALRTTRSTFVQVIGFSKDDVSRRRRGFSLTLREDANQRTPRWRLRAKIANESSLGPDLHMTGRALGAVNQHRSHRRFVRI